MLDACMGMSGAHDVTVKQLWSTCKSARLVDQGESALVLTESAVSTWGESPETQTESMHSRSPVCFRGYANEQGWNVTF